MSFVFAVFGAGVWSDYGIGAIPIVAVAALLIMTLVGVIGLAKVRAEETRLVLGDFAEGD